MEFKYSDIDITMIYIDSPEPALLIYSGWFVHKDKHILLPVHKIDKVEQLCNAIAGYIRQGATLNQIELKVGEIINPT